MTASPPPPYPGLQITISGETADGLSFEFHCLRCGGWELRVAGPALPATQVYCKACGDWKGSLASIRLHCAMIGQAAGHKVNLEEFGITKESQDALWRRIWGTDPP